MDFSMIIGELKCMKAKWCSYTAIFHHLKQCLNNLVSKTKTQEGIKKKKKTATKPSSFLWDASTSITL